MEGSLDIINCPLCRKEMKKVFLDEQKIHVDICLDGCGGIFLDNREINKIDDIHENIEEILSAIKEKTFEIVVSEEQKICPVCNTPMVEIGADKGLVKIDNCNVCGAKFLDNGELQKIREAVVQKNEMLDNMLQNIFEYNFEKATYGLAPDEPSPRRQAFENFIRRFI